MPLRYAFALLVVPLGLAAQQPDSTSLPRVVITATRVNTTLGARTSTVTVLQGEELRRAGVRDAADALRLVPGVSIVRSGSQGAQTSIFVRGGESDYVRVLVDGVQMNDPGGAIDLASLTLDNIDRIEVVRGPVSVLYGTDAVTGVVQVFTRSGAERSSMDVGTRVARYGERAADVTLGGSSARVNGTVAVAQVRTDGLLAFNNQYRNNVASARVNVMPSDASRGTVSARLTDDTFHYPTDGAGNVVDRNAYRSDRRSIASFDYEQRAGSRVRFGSTLSALEGRGRSVDDRDGPADTSGFYAYRSAGSLRRRGADGRIHVSLSPSVLATVGGEWVFEAQRSADSSNYDVARNRFAGDRSNRAAYAQVIGERNRVSLSLGGRYDDNRTFGIFRTGRGAVAVRAWHGATLRGSLGTAFKAPTFYETFSTAFTVGNPELTPERSRSRELGVAQDVGSARLSATWFDQDFRNLIQYTYQSPTAPNYFNVAAASARGLELETSAGLGRSVHAGASVTLLRTRVDDAGFDSGNGATFVRGERLLRRPTVSAAFTMSATQGRHASATLTVLYVGERDDRDFSDYPAAPVVLPAYTRADLGVERRVWGGADRGSDVVIRASVSNLFGKAYHEVFNFPAPGRVLGVGLRVSARR